jgi:lysine 2,3-aminomutase
MFFFRKAKKHPFWKNIPDSQWNDWTWQLKNRVADPRTLGGILNLSPEETGRISHSLNILRMAITPYYLSQSRRGIPTAPSACRQSHAS